jgi:capsular polysaccharide biosynthesis protein
LTLADVDHVYCPRPPSRAAAQLLDRLEVPPEKRVWAAPDTLIQADVLLVPSLPSTSLTYHSWLPEFLRRAVEVSKAPPPRRRIYVSRRGFSRQVADEERLLALLLERDFEIYDPSDRIDQPDDFFEAAVVVGAHGAALANLAFCRPGTRVLELLPTDNAYPFYYSLASAGGLTYGYLAGESRGKRAPGSFGPSPHDFVVDPGEFTAALDDVAAG